MHAICAFTFFGQEKVNHASLCPIHIHTLLMCECYLRANISYCLSN